MIQFFHNQIYNLIYMQMHSNINKCDIRHFHQNIVEQYGIEETSEDNCQTNIK